jgi:hypothetical protein
VSRSSFQQSLSPDEYQLLNEVLEELVNDFGLGPVRQEINRRPRPLENGRPKVWDDHRLFSLWLIVQTWVLAGSCNVNAACKALENATAGLTM